MDTLVLAILIFLLILLIVLVVILFLSQHKTKQDILKRDQNYYKYMENMNNQMNQNMMVFQDIVNNNLNNLSNTTFERFSHMESKVYDGINRGLNMTNTSFSKVMNSLGKIDEAQNNIKHLASDINELHMILNDKKTRGIYGEVELSSLLGTLFADNRQMYELQYKLSNGNIVDCVIKGQYPLDLICVDAKFPLENYNRIFNASNKTEQLLATKEFKKNVMKHIKDIHDKYLTASEVYTLGLMFIPAEAIFAYIYGQFSDIIEYAYQMHVIIVSPTTLMSYITALKALHIKQKRDENVIYIQRQYEKLSVEVERFNTRYQTLVKDFNKIYTDMQSLSITTDKLLKQFELINKVDLEGVLEDE